MTKKNIKSFWLNIGAVDRDMDLSGRQQILRALSDIGVEVRTTFNYIHRCSVSTQDYDRVWLYRLRPGIGQIGLTLRQQWLLLRNLDVDVIVVRAWKLHETLPLFFWCRYVLGKKEVKFVLDLRTLPVDLPAGWRGVLAQYRFDHSLRVAMRFFDGLMVITEKLKQNIVEQYGTDPEKIQVWTTGVDTEHFDPQKKTDAGLQRELQNRFVVMYHGFFSPNRGLNQAVEAVARLKERHPNILLFLLGKGPGLKGMQACIKQHGVEEHVRIHPPVPFAAVPQYLNCADIGVLPFPDLDWWNTSGPLKLNEYLSMGKPVVLTDIAAHRLVIQDAQFGFYAQNEDPNHLANAIEKAILKRTELADIGRSARSFALANLTWESQALKIKTYFCGFKKASGK